MKKKKWKKPKFKHVVGDLYKTKWGWYVTCPKHLSLGKNTDIGIGTYINARYGVEIEDDVQIGSNCSIYSHNTINETKGPIFIGKGAKIGSYSLVLPNTIIYRHEFIKARSNVRIGKKPEGFEYPEGYEEFMDWIRGFDR